MTSPFADLRMLLPAGPLLLAIFFTTLWAVGHAIVSRRKDYRYQSTETGRFIARKLPPRFTPPPISLQVALLLLPVSLVLSGAVLLARFEWSPLSNFINSIAATLPPPFERYAQFAFTIWLSIVPVFIVAAFLRKAYQFHETVAKAELGCCPFCGYATWASVEHGGNCSECGEFRPVDE